LHRSGEQFTRLAKPAPALSGDPPTGPDAFGRSAYDTTEQEVEPEAALVASLGRGNPTACAQLRTREVVLDLGWAGGSMFRSRHHGLDLTPEMPKVAATTEELDGL
jgi:arsenite methyltransferase